ncbi:MAG: hypothetical protein EAZ40_00380 [Rhodobacterales bacterium]|nr:MAG: hypothetical protein EAZ40_00380 [Rhodobacterales bacterium]
MLPVGLADFMRGTLLRIVWPVNGILHGFVLGRYRSLVAPETAGKRGPIRKKTAPFQGRGQSTGRKSPPEQAAGPVWQDQTGRKGLKMYFDRKT